MRSLRLNRLLKQAWPSDYNENEWSLDYQFLAKGFELSLPIATARYTKYT